MQLVLLSTAASRDSGSLLPLPESVVEAEPVRLSKAMQALLKTGYAAEGAAAEPTSIWREDGDRFCVRSPNATGGGSRVTSAKPGSRPEKTLDSFAIDAVPIIWRAQVIAICAGDGWLEKGANLILLGAPAAARAISPPRSAWH